MDEVKTITETLETFEEHEIYAYKLDDDHAKIWLDNTPKQKYHRDDLKKITSKRSDNFIPNMLGVINRSEPFNGEQKRELYRFIVRIQNELIPDEVETQKTQKTHKSRNAEGERYSKQALELLKDPELLDRIGNVLSNYITVEVNNKKYLFLCLIQSFTKNYLQLTVIAPSSTGKTHLVRNVLNLFPPETRESVGRLSKTALERIDWDSREGVKIIWVKEARGKRASADSIRLSSMDDGGMKAWVTNSDKGGVDIFNVPPLTIVTTQTSQHLHHEDDTRNVKIFCDTSRDQTDRIIDFEAEEAKYPEPLKEVLEDNSKEHILIVRQAIRLLEKDLDVLIPYTETLAKNVDKSKLRIRRDFKKLLGHIKASTLLHQKQREIIQFEDGKKLILANIQDLNIAMRLSEKPLTQTYYNLSDDERSLINIVKELNEDEDINFTKYPHGVSTELIFPKVDEILGYQETWTREKLRGLREKSAIKYKEVRDPVKIYYYKPLMKLPSSIFKGEIDDSEIKQETIERIDELREKLDFELIPPKNIEQLETSILTETYTNT